MIIGNFTYTQHDDSYAGDINTLALEREHVGFFPVNKSRENDPDYYIVTISFRGKTDLGAAWKRRDKQGIEYLSARLSDPILGIEINARLIRTREDRAELWCSPGKPKAKAK